MPGVVQIALRGTSAFLLLDRRVTLIDTGLRGSARRLLQAVRLAGRRADEIEQVIITHYHPDHIGGLPELQRILPAKAAIHAIDAPAVTGAGGPPSPFNAGWRRAAWRKLAPRLLPFEPVRIDELLHDGDELPVLGGLRIVHTPGHTPGHVALYLPELALLIAGDAMEYRRGRLTGPAAAVTADMPEALRSIDTLSRLAIETIAFSHFPSIPAAAGERLRELAARLPGE